MSSKKSYPQKFNVEFRIFHRNRLLLEQFSPFLSNKCPPLLALGKYFSCSRNYWRSSLMFLLHSWRVQFIGRYPRSLPQLFITYEEVKPIDWRGWQQAETFLLSLPNNESSVPHKSWTTCFLTKKQRHAWGRAVACLTQLLRFWLWSKWLREMYGQLHGKVYVKFEILSNC